MKKTMPKKWGNDAKKLLKWGQNEVQKRQKHIKKQSFYGKGDFHETIVITA